MINNLKFDFSFFNNFPHMFFVLTEEGNILELNTCAINLFEIRKEDVIGKSFLDFIDPLYTDNFNARIRKEAGSETGMHTTGIINLNGKSLITDLFIKTHFSDSKLIYFVQARDITGEKQRERDLIKFYSVAENTVNPLQITDLNGNMVYVNKAFETASGYSKEELINNNPSIFGSGKHSKKFWSKMWSTIRSGRVWVGEVENKRKNGESFFTQLLISPILDESGNVASFFGVHRDLTEKKMLEKQLIHTQKMESIGTLAAGVAHEVGNPLASISALVQVIQRSTDDQFAKDKLELVKSQVTRISKIIRDLVDFSRPSNYELQLTDVNLNIVEAVEIVKVGAKAKSIDFVVELEDDIPRLPLVADQVQQVFVNILLNAVDVIFMANEELPEKRIIVRSYVEDDAVVATFEDTGTGIKEEHLIKIFEPFFTTKKEGRGTGLGLWVSYGIIKSFQGDLKVSSVYGRGTTFTVVLPIQP